MKKLTITPKNLIVRMPNWVGDVVMATPILADLRHHWPETRITAMCQGSLSTLLLEDPHLDELISFKRPSGWIHRKEHGDIIEPLREGHYDCGILLTNSFSSAWWFWRGHVENRVGFAAHWRSCLLDMAVPVPKNINKQHLVVTYKMLLEPLGIPASNSMPALYVTRQEEMNAREQLKNFGITKQNRVVGISPGAAFGSAKCWLPERFREVTQKLIEDPNVFVIYFGDKSTAPMINDICLGMPERVINLAGKTSLRELMAGIKVCHVFLANDSGPMHMAYALGVPVIAIFGPTTDVISGPLRNGLAIHKHVECSPCFRRECPIDWRCMKSIGVDEVYNAILKMLNKNTT